MNAAAYTDVDGCETNRDACFAVNAEGVRNIACACKDSGAKIVHYSTDYVFDGTKGEPYLEDDPCRPINAYGASKRKGEQVLIETAENHVLIRTAWLYGRQGKNFVKAILAKARDEGMLRVVDDQVGSPTFSFDLAQATKLLVERDCRGIYHVTNRGVCSWFQFAQRILEYAQVSGVTVEPIKSHELSRKAEAPGLLGPEQPQIHGSDTKNHAALAGGPERLPHRPEPYPPVKTGSQGSGYQGVEKSFSFDPCHVTRDPEREVWI